MINPLIEIRKQSKVVYRGFLTAAMARERAEPDCSRCHGTGVLHLCNDAGTETDAACSCVLGHMEKRE